MMEWHDYWRILNALAAIVSVVLLGRRFGKSASSWNTKTRDYWFALTMWCMAGFFMMLEGLLLDYELGPRLVFVSAGIFVTLRGLTRKGTWGDRSAAA